MWEDYEKVERFKNIENYVGEKNKYYSQYNQDRNLENAIFKGYKKGVFVDVGAYDGVDINNTLYFETTNNWRGINIEPIEEVYKRLESNRKKSINIKTVISDKEELIEFIILNNKFEMLSGIKKNYSDMQKMRVDIELQEELKTTEELKNIEELKRIKLIKTERLETILDKYNILNINYLSIDVEGSELNVVKSINFEKVFIDVIGFENNRNIGNILKEILKLDEYNIVSDIEIENLKLDEYNKEREIVNYLKKNGFVELETNCQGWGDIFMINSKSEFLTDDVKKLIVHRF
jgi:FkbM family methyltransferase